MSVSLTSGTKACFLTKIYCSSIIEILIPYDLISLKSILFCFADILYLGNTFYISLQVSKSVFFYSLILAAFYNIVSVLYISARFFEYLVPGFEEEEEVCMHSPRSPWLVLQPSLDLCSKKFMIMNNFLFLFDKFGMFISIE